MHSNWKLRLDARTEFKAAKVLRRLESAWDRSINVTLMEERDSGGHDVWFSFDHGGRSRAETVVEAIALAEYIGGRWSLSGPVQGDFGMISVGPRFQGIEVGEFHLTCNPSAPD